MCPSQRPIGSAIAVATRSRASDERRWLPAQLADLAEAADLRRVPALDSRSWKMNSNASAEGPERGERRHHADRPLARAVSRRWMHEHEQVAAPRPAGRQQPPATTTLPRNVDVRRRCLRPEAAGAGEEGEAPRGRRSSWRRSAAPARISGSASGSSTRTQDLVGASCPCPRAASTDVRAARSRRPGDDVAEDDQQRVGGQRDDRGDVAAAGDREQQQERPRARDRVRMRS